MPTPRFLFRPSARLAPLALAALCLGGTARAQSLQELYEAARSYDATYLAARSQSEAAEYQAAQTYALQRPSVGLTASANRNVDETPYSPSTTRTSSTTTPVTVSAQQSLFNRPNSLTIDQADKTVEVAKSQLQAAEQDLIVRLSQAYFDVLAASDTLATVQANKKAISEQLASDKRNFEVGTATITDANDAQARHDLAYSQEIAAQNDLEVKKQALRQIIGNVPSSLSRISGGFAAQLPTPNTMEAWVEQSAAASPQIKAAQMAYEVATQEVTKNRGGHLPTLDAVASYAEAGQGAGHAPEPVADEDRRGAGSDVGASLERPAHAPMFAHAPVPGRASTEPPCPRRLVRFLPPKGPP